MPSLTNNQLLDVLSPGVRDTILAFSEPLPLPIHRLIQQQDQHPQSCYFITSGLASVVVALSDGNISEVALVGHEGLTGSSSFLGPSAPPTQCAMQIDGSGLRASLSDLQGLFASSEEFRNRVLEFVQM